MNFKYALSALVLGASLSVSGAAPVAAQQINNERVDAYVAQFGDQERLNKTFEVIEQTSLFTKALPKDDLATLRTAMGIIKSLAALSGEGELLGPIMDFQMSFLPDKPDPILFALEQIQVALDTIHNEMIANFTKLANENQRNFLDSAAHKAIGDIDGSHEAYMNYLKVINKSAESGEENSYLGGIISINERELLTATSDLAKLCVGSELFGGQNIFDAHMRDTNGDFMGMLRIGNYILNKIVNAQAAHGARILYAGDPKLTPKGLNIAIKIANESHQKSFETCLDTIEDRIFAISNRDDVIEFHARTFLKNYKGSVKASTIGKELKRRYPMWEWAVISYRHNPRQGDKRKVNWAGDNFVKVKISATQHVIASYFPISDAGYEDATDCRANIIAFNTKAARIKTETLHFPSQRNYIPDFCAQTAENAPLIWASHRTGATIWTSDPLSIQATASDKLEIYNFERVKYLIVGKSRKRCSGIVPDWDRLAGVGGGKFDVFFVSKDDEYSKHRPTTKSQPACFTSRGLSFDSTFGVNPGKADVTAVLNYRAFRKSDREIGRNFVFLSDGTYRVVSDREIFKDRYEAGNTTDRWPGITAEQAKMIVGATAMPSLGNVYFFFKDGTYSRFPVANGRVDLATYPIEKGWVGVRGSSPSPIVGVADYDETEQMIYFFYNDGQYAAYNTAQRRVTFEGPVSNWK